VRLGLRFRLVLLLVATVAVSVSTAFALQRWRAPWPVLIVGIALATWMASGAMYRFVLFRQTGGVIQAVADGLLSFAERDYTMRLAVAPEGELADLVRRFNTLGQVLRADHNDHYQKEMLLETVLETTSMTVVLCNEGQRVVYANGAARDLLGGGKKLEGQDFLAVLEAAPAELRDAVKNHADTLFTVDDEGHSETYHLTRRYFLLSAQRHVLYILRPLTRVILRKEAETWKKAIRVIGHELNNSLAPILSLIHSARMILKQPEMAPRLAGVLDTIEERAAHLRGFLEGYARFARLPTPTKQETRWTDLVEGVKALHTFRQTGDLPAEPAMLDRAQMQQVLINLIKNAIEAGGSAEEITLSVTIAAGGGFDMRIDDRGKGMTDEVMKKALLPFYSTKPSGSGLGLPLCREIVEAHGGKLSLHAREGGGLTVHCWIP
jgi:nitrogen fixation/metabolism regulation signal transduction histidine kinase